MNDVANLTRKKLNCPMSVRSSPANHVQVVGIAHSPIKSPHGLYEQTCHCMLLVLHNWHIYTKCSYQLYHARYCIQTIYWRASEDFNLTRINTMIYNVISLHKRYYLLMIIAINRTISTISVLYIILRSEVTQDVFTYYC